MKEGIRKKEEVHLPSYPSFLPFLSSFLPSFLSSFLPSKLLAKPSTVFYSNCLFRLVSKDGSCTCTGIKNQVDDKAVTFYLLHTTPPYNHNERGE
jgi:hypothetical protein